VLEQPIKLDPGGPKIDCPLSPGKKRYLIEFEAGIINAARAVARRAGYSLNSVVRSLLLEYLTRADRLADAALTPIELREGGDKLVRLRPPRRANNADSTLTLHLLELEPLPEGVFTKTPGRGYSLPPVPADPDDGLELYAGYRASRHRDAQAARAAAGDADADGERAS
jgi:hypothetical protein